MRNTLVLLLALLLALPFGACGEGMDVPVDAFIQRAGIEADAGLREGLAGDVLPKEVPDAE